MSDGTTNGATLDPAALTRFLDRVLTTNLSRCSTGATPVPVCIWGTHGIGKTALVEQIAEANGWNFAYAAPAQFEEMGDLHGLPVIKGDHTTFAAPDWAPTEDGPGILLLDDMNRADDRILRGLMQLLQRGELVSWSLPSKWQIVVTANPETGDYSVTPMDDAMLTRMLHVTMAFDAKAWASWAVASGVDVRGVNFVLTYPEIVTGARTTPRSLTQFFDQIADISDLRSDRELVHALAMSALDDVTATAFLSFVSDGLETLVEPHEILDAKSFTDVGTRLDALATDQHGVRIDRLNTIAVRLFLAMTADDYAPGARHQKNLVAFLKHPALPNDLRFGLHRDMVSRGGTELREMLRDKELAELTLAAL